MIFLLNVVRVRSCVVPFAFIFENIKRGERFVSRLIFHFFVYFTSN